MTDTPIVRAAIAAMQQGEPVAGEQSALVARLRATGEPVPERIWLHGIGSHGGEVTWASEPDPSGTPEEAEWAVEYVLAASAPSDKLEAENAALRELLEKSREGWENVLEFGIIPPQHRTAARILADDARQALREPTK